MTFPHFHGKEKQRGGSRTLRENPAHAAAEKIRPTARSKRSPYAVQCVSLSPSVKSVPQSQAASVSRDLVEGGSSSEIASVARPLSVVAHTDWLFALN